MGLIVYNGLSSKDYHIQVEHPPGYDTPEEDVELYHVVGRNGDLIIRNGSYKNVTRKYQIAFVCGRAEYSRMASGLSEWLHSASGYARLEDSYEPEYFRLAMYRESTSLSNIVNRGGRATISFDCKPQRYLKSGERPLVMENGASLYNETFFSALPLIELTGSGVSSLAINGCRVDFKETFSGPVWLDCDTMNAYWESLNRNEQIHAPTFPVLKSGENRIEWSGGIKTVTIIPRWWTL